MTVAWFWPAAGPAIALGLAGLAEELRRGAYIRERLGAAPGRLPPASVIVPVKGEEEGLRLNLAALAAQEYPDYELIVTARTALEIPAGVLPARAKVVVGRPDVPGAGEKIGNLLAGVKATRQGSEVLAFADSDGRPGPGWLRALAAALDEPGVGAATGYRWHTPVPAGFWPALRGAWDAAIAGRLGPGNNRFAWGGAMAIRKETFFRVRVPEQWMGAVSDDYALAAAVRGAGLRIAFAPGALVATPERVDARGFLAWARRQLVITRIARPGLWRAALVSHVVYCGGMACAAGASLAYGAPAAAALGAQIALGMARGALRARTARRQLPGWERWFRSHGWKYWMLAPLATWAWLFLLLASAAGGTIEWRGRRYDLRAPAEKPAAARKG